jgi:hypothetical protein
MQKRLLYFTATRVLLYRWAHARLAVESSYANNEEGAQAFAAQLHGTPASLFYVLVDIVEEDFHQENVPFVRGGDRRALLARKLAQRYRDTSLALALSLGYEKTQRRDERILFSSFTNNAQFQPWLTALREQDAAVAGVYSVALLGPQLAAKLGSKKAPLLLVSLQQAGLRQTYVENGKIRFSRLGPLEAGEIGDPARVADAFDRETTRVYQYLTAMRVVAREGGAIDAVLIAPTGEKRRVQAAGPNMPQVRATVVELGEAARAIGLKDYPEGAGAEVLFLHLLAQRAPVQQYAGDTLRQYFRLHQLRVGLVAGGALAFLIALGYSGILLMQRYTLEEQIGIDRQRAQAAADEAARVRTGFPVLPTRASPSRARPPSGSPSRCRSRSTHRPRSKSIGSDGRSPRTRGNGVATAAQRRAARPCRGSRPALPRPPATRCTSSPKSTARSSASRPRTTGGSTPRSRSSSRICGAGRASK